MNQFMALDLRTFEWAQSFSPTYKGGLANHLPMVLIAMDAINASSAEILHFIDTYKNKLEAITENPQPIDEHNWQHHLGIRHCYKSYRNYFNVQIAMHGIKNVMLGHMDKLIQGCCASAFHCIIRLGLGLKVNNVDEVANGLAFFASEFQSLGEIKSQSSPSDSKKNINLNDMVDWLDNNDSLHDLVFDAPNIFVRLDGVAKNAEFHLLNKQLIHANIHLNDIADLCLRLFTSTYNFTALHAVTSSHAFRFIIPFIKNKPLALRYFLQAILAAAISIGLPRLNTSPVKVKKNKQDIHWDALFKKAINSDNDHKIKIVFSCFEEHRFYNNDQYYLAALNALNSDI